MKALLTFLLFLNLVVAQGSESILWNKGSVVEKNGNVRVGEVAFQSAELILFRADDKVMVYTPFHLRSFFYFDQNLLINRKYSSLSIDKGNHSLFFEIVIWGEIQVVRLIKTKGLMKGRLDDVGDFNYYVNQQSHFTKIENFKKEVYPTLLENKPALEHYIQQMKLTPSYLVNVISIIKLYNRLYNNEMDLVARTN